MTRARMPRPHEVAIARRDPRLLSAIDERRSDEAWRTRGACRTVDPETFFPAPNEPSESAVALCGTCEVRGRSSMLGDVRSLLSRGEQISWLSVHARAFAQHLSPSR